jgi:hypothetical protein
LSSLATTSIPFGSIEEILPEVAPRQKLFLIYTCESGEADSDALGAPRALPKGLAARVLPTASRRGLAVAPRATAKAMLERDRYIWNDLARRSGSIVFSAYRADEYSMESDAWGQGAFTAAILRAFTDKAADKNKVRILSIGELRAYVSAAVPRMVKAIDPSAEQHPVVDRDNIYADFGFEAVKQAKVGTPLQGIKKRFMGLHAEATLLTARYR